MPRGVAQALPLQPPGEFKSHFPQVVSLCQQLSLKYVHHYVVTEQDLETVGQALWQTLAADEILQDAHRNAGLKVLPLLLDSNDPLVQTLPWECLHHPQHGFLGKQSGFSLTRRQPELTAVADAPPRGPLKVLLFTSLPDDVDLGCPNTPKSLAQFLDRSVD